MTPASTSERLSPRSRAVHSCPRNRPRHPFTGHSSFHVRHDRFGQRGPLTGRRAAPSGPVPRPLTQEPVGRGGPSRPADCSPRRLAPHRPLGGPRGRRRRPQPLPLAGAPPPPPAPQQHPPCAQLFPGNTRPSFSNVPGRPPLTEEGRGPTCQEMGGEITYPEPPWASVDPAVDVRARTGPRPRRKAAPGALAGPAASGPSPERPSLAPRVPPPLIRTGTRGEWPQSGFARRLTLHPVGRGRCHCRGTCRLPF